MPRKHNKPMQRLSLYIDSELYEEMKGHCTENDIVMSRFVEKAIVKEVKKVMKAKK